VLAIVTRAVAFAAMVLTSGAVTFRFGVLRRWPTPTAASAAWNALIARAGALAAACLVLVAPLRLYAQARSLVEAGDPVMPMMLSVLQTSWGRGWNLQTAASGIVLLGLLAASRGARSGWGIALVSALGLTLSPALMGHAVASERLLVVSVLADWLHVTMAGAWVGALSMLMLVARTPAAAGAGVNAPTSRLIELFHPVALAGSSVLVLTGAVSLLLRVDHLGDLLHSAYGAIFGLKLGLTLVVAAFGLHHSRRGVALAGAGGSRALLRSLSTEVALAALVIATTAVLVGTSPPMRMALHG